jgi:hypothetical protein
MPEEQALAYVHTSSMDKTDPDHDWLALIREARSYAARISGRAQLQPAISELEPRYKDYLEKVQLNPTFKEQLAGTTSFRFVSVELAKLRCSQGVLSLEHVSRVLKDTPTPQDHDATTEFCLPLREDGRGTRSFWSTSASSYSTVLVSENLNFRVAGLAQGEDNVTGRKLTAVVYGFGSPQIAVSEYKGKYIIVNGHHRVYSLLKKGHKMAPCLLLTSAEYYHKGPASHSVIPQDMVMSDNPPFLADFDADAAITVPRRRSIVVINVHAEAQEVSI